ncbi:MAG TPA: alpha/beta fold hydrolase [Rhodanobacteraceae bacterium]
MSERLILLHGLWMPGISMSVLQRRLESAGYVVDSFDYLSVTTPLDVILADLRERLRAGGEGTHVVGHSLGGLLALLACNGRADLPSGRIVCLASPLSGSAVARWFDEHVGSRMLGPGRELLLHGLAHWDGPREVGMLAGQVAVGLGSMIGQVDGPNDGTVTVAETRLPGLIDHCVVPASHTGMLLSRTAAAQAVAFLRHGRFRDDLRDR